MDAALKPWSRLAVLLLVVSFLLVPAQPTPARTQPDSEVLFDSALNGYAVTADEAPLPDPIDDWPGWWYHFDQNVRMRLVLEEDPATGGSRLVATLHSRQVSGGLYASGQWYDTKGDLSTGAVALALPETVSAELEAAQVLWRKVGAAQPEELFYTTDCGVGDFYVSTLADLLRDYTIEHTKLGKVLNRAMDLWQDLAACEPPGEVDLLAGTLFEREDTHDILVLPWRLEGADAGEGAAITVTLPVDQPVVTVLQQLDLYGAAVDAKLGLQAVKLPSQATWVLNRRLEIRKDDIRGPGHTPAPPPSGWFFWNEPGTMNEVVLWTSALAGPDSYRGDLAPGQANYPDYRDIADNLLTTVSLADAWPGSGAGSVLLVTVEGQTIEGGYIPTGADTWGTVGGGDGGSIHLAIPESLAVANYADAQTWLWHYLNEAPVKAKTADLTCSLGIADWLLGWVPGWKLITWTNGLLGATACSLSASPAYGTVLAESWTHDTLNGSWDLSWVVGWQGAARVQLAIPLVPSKAEALALLDPASATLGLYASLPMAVDNSSQTIWVDYELLVGSFTDNAPPEVTALYVSQPEPAGLEIGAVAGDNVGVDHVRFAPSGPSPAPECIDSDGPNGSGRWTCQWDTSSWQAGQYLIQVTAYDRAGNAGSMGTSTLIQQPAQPLIGTVTVTPDKSSYAPGEQVSLAVALRDNSNAPVAGATLEFAVDGAPHTCAEAGVACAEQGSGSYTVAFSAPAAAGEYDVAVTAAKAGYLPGSGGAAITVAPPGEPGHDVRINNIFITPGSYDPWDTIAVQADVQNIGLYEETVRLVFKLRDPGGAVVAVDDHHQFQLQAGSLSLDYSVDLQAGAAEGDYLVEVTAEIAGHGDQDPANNRDVRHVYVGDLPAFIEFAVYERYADVGATTSPPVEGYTIHVIGVYQVESNPEQTYAEVDVLYNGSPVPDGFNERVYLYRINLFDSNQVVVILNGTNPGGALFRLGKGGTTGISFDPGTAVAPAGGTATFRAQGPAGSNLEDFVVDSCESYNNNANCDDDYATVSTWSLDDDEIENNLADVLIDVPPTATPRTHEFWLTFRDRNAVSDHILRKLWIDVEPRHDIQVQALTPDGQTIPVGTIAPIQATVANVGGQPEYALDVVCTVAGPGGYTAVMEQTIASLPPGSTVYPVFNWATAGLAPGSYTMAVQVPLSSDPYPGDNSLSAANSLEMPPQLAASLQAGGSTWLQLQTVQITGTVTAEGGPVDGASVSYWLTDGAGQTVATGSLAPGGGGGGVYAAAFAAPIDTGAYSLRLTAAQSGYLSGSSAPLAVAVETAPPETYILSDHPAGGELINYNDVPFNWVGADLNTPVDQLRYATKLDGTPWTGWITATSALLGDLAEGPHQFWVKAYGLPGVEDPTPASRSFTVDTVPPAFDLPPAASAAVYQDGDTIQVTVDLDGAAQVTADFAAIDSQYNPAAVSVVETDPAEHLYLVSYPVSAANSYPDNRYLILVQATDAAGNSRTDASLVVRLDNDNPSIVARAPQAGEIVPYDAEIAVTFSEQMDQASVAAAFSVEPELNGWLEWSGNTAVYSHTADLTCETYYTATVTTAAVDLVGKPLDPAVWSFQAMTCGPEIYHTPVITAAEQISLPIEATITTAFPAVTATLYYRPAGAADYTALPMVQTSGAVYSATVPGSAVTLAGLDYYLAAVAGGRTVLHPPSGAHHVQGVPLCDAVTEIPRAECQALAALYNSTGGANWVYSTGWMRTKTPCNWHGVQCSGGHVWRLVLYTNGLNGALPPELGDLSGLQVLALSGNPLSGTIPPELGNLSELQSLALDSNQLSGPIPPELGNLSDLLYLQLGGNQLSGPIPPELGDLANLQLLTLPGNQISGSIPPEVGDLSSLQVINLGANQLTGGIPPELGSLANLTHLHLYSNPLGGTIPPELGNLASLQVLRLDDDQLTGAIPPEFSNLIGVVSISLQDNHLTGNVPSFLGSLTSLVWLDLSNNRLGGEIPVELGNLSELSGLDLSSNVLGGEIPSAIASLTALTYADLGYNMLTASDPALIAFLDEKDPDWAQTQTLPPSDLQAGGTTCDAVELAWTPIAYTWDGGYYQVSYATTPGGPYTVHGATGSKTAAGYLAGGLLPATTYYWVVRTYTPARVGQQNDLWSAYSQEIAAATTSTCTFRVYLPVVARSRQQSSALAPLETAGRLDRSHFWPYNPLNRQFRR